MNLSKFLNKKITLVLTFLFIIVLAMVFYHSHSPNVILSNTFIYNGKNFSLELLNGYLADNQYVYQEFGPGKDISGVKFTIPEAVAKGTNLSTDSYISVEEIPGKNVCTTSLFLEQGTPHPLIENKITYSVASFTGAAAGNRYDETVYVFSRTNLCMAIRYFIHYGVFENYPAGTVKKFDEQSLLSQFDQIRHTLILK